MYIIIHLHNLKPLTLWYNILYSSAAFVAFSRVESREYYYMHLFFKSLHREIIQLRAVLYIIF